MTQIARSNVPTKITRLKRHRDMQLEETYTKHGRVSTYVLDRNTHLGNKGSRMASMVIEVKPDKDESWARHQARQSAEDLLFRAWVARFGPMQWDKLQIRIVHLSCELIVEYRVQNMSNRN